MALPLRALAVAAAVVATSAAAAECDRRDGCKALQDVPDLLLVQAKWPRITRRLPWGSQPKAWEAQPLQCTFGAPVTISSHRLQNLQDNNGVLNLFGNSGSWEQWTLSDAGDGKVSISSSDGRHLGDDQGTPVLLDGGHEHAKWSIEYAGRGKVHLVSYRGEHLGDWEGVLNLHGNKGDWEAWYIGLTNGTMACRSEQAAAEELTAVRMRMLQAERQLFGEQKVLREGCGVHTTTGQPVVDVGRCAAFGDPHFITFDGGHTTYVGDMIMWIVRSTNVWMQGLSVDSTGNFMGFAVGGPFLEGHTIVVYKNTAGGLEVTYDGEHILQGENDEFHVDGLVDAWRSVSWDADLHDREVLQLRTEMRFSVGPWPERFLGNPQGGLVLLRLPGNVEVTMTGVDFMSGVITMPAQEGGQSGYCGNFNGDASDDFEPIAPSWNKPVGEDLDPVSESLNLFNGSDALNWTKKAWNFEAPQMLEEKARKFGDCSEELKQKAAEECKHVATTNMKWDCMFDICVTGDVEAAKGILAAEVLSLKVDTKGSAEFIGFGRCQDEHGHRYAAFETLHVRSEAACRLLLRELAFHQGVRGAELMRTSTCRILVEGDVDLTGVLADARWKQGGPTTDTTSTSGAGLISSASNDPAWSCWAAV